MTNWGKQYEAATKRIMKGGKQAADTAVFNAETERRLMEEAKAKKAAELAEQKSNKGGINVNTTQITNLIQTAMTEMFQQYRERELGMQIRLQEAKNQEIELRKTNAAVQQETIEMMKSFQNQMTAMEQRISDKFLELEILNRKIELARLQAVQPIEFELTPFMSSTAGKVEEVVDEHTAAVETILDAIVITEEKPERKKRVGRPKGSKNRKNKVEEVMETVNTDSDISRDAIKQQLILEGLSRIPTVDCPIPDEYFTFRGVDWKRIDEEGIFMDTLFNLIQNAAANGIDVNNAMQFKKYNSVCNGAYQRYTKANPGRGAWKALMMEFGLNK